MTREIKKLKTGEFLFYLGYTLFIVTSLLDLTGLSYIIGSSPKEPTKLNIIIKYLRYFSYIVLFAKIVITTKKKRIWFFVVPLVFLLFSLIYYSSGNIELLFYLLVIVSAEKIDSNRIFKIIMYSQTTILAMIIIMSSIGILNDLVIDPGYRNRHYLGFLYTTTSADLLFFIILEYTYIHKGILKGSVAIAFFIACVALMILTDTRLTFLLTLFSILYFQIIYKRRKKNLFTKKTSRLLLLFPSLICVLSLVMYISYSPSSSVWQTLDRLLSYRFTYSYRAIMGYGFSLFGQPIEFMLNYDFVDSSFLQIALEFGIIALLVVIGIYTMVMRRAIEYNKKYLVDMIVLIMLFSVTQTRLFTFSYNAIPLLLVSKIDGNERKLNYRSIKRKYIL